MSNQTTTHHGPAAPGPASGAQETGIDGLAHLVDDLAQAMATTPEAVLAGMSDDVLHALFRLHVQGDPSRGPRPDGEPEPGRTRATR